jgi:hypothetical protein
MFKMKGIVEIRKTNLETGNVEIIEDTNTIMLQTLKTIISSTATEGTVSAIGPYIGISTLSSTPVNTETFDSASTMVVGYTASGVVSPQFVLASGGVPDYTQWLQRFDPPGSGQRNINSILLLSGTSTSSNTLYARCLLSTTCVQTTTEVLDIYYRIQWLNDTTTAGNCLPIAKQTFAKAISGLTTLNGPSYNGFPSYITTSFSGKLPLASSAPYLSLRGLDSAAGDWPSGGQFMPSTDSANLNYYKRKLVMNEVLATYPGVIHGSLLYNLYGVNYPTTYTPPMSWHNVFPPNTSLQNCVQTINNHASTSTIPFIDVSNLASSQGTPVVNGSGWTNPNFPEYYRIDITGTGEPGTAKYAFSQRRLLGFDGNVYDNRPCIVHWIVEDSNPAWPNQHGALPLNGTQTALNGWGALPYDSHSIITHDGVGLNWISLVDGSHMAWDSSTTPALNSTQIRQVAVDLSGNIWVACRATGLYKINKTANTITQMSISGVTNQCFGVDIGYNGAICAVMNGGVVISTNNGANWTVYNSSSTPAFTYLGISDNNWASVQYLRVDPSTADNRMLLVRSWSTLVNQTVGSVWWSISLGASIGPTLNQWVRQCQDALNVSDNGWWVYIPTQSSGSYFYSTVFGTQVTSAVNSSISSFYGSNNTITFETGPAGEDVILGITYPITPGHAVTLIRRDGTTTSSQVTSLTSANNTQGSWFESYRLLYLGHGVLTWSSNTANTSRVNIASSASYNRQEIMMIGFDNTSYGGKNGYLAWNNYRWNPNTSTWVNRYSAPLTDSSSYAVNASRYNFPIESYQYTFDATHPGSYSIANSTISTGNFSNQFTWATTVQSSQATGTESDLIDYFTPPTNYGLQFAGSTLNGMAYTSSTAGFSNLSGSWTFECFFNTTSTSTLQFICESAAIYRMGFFINNGKLNYSLSSNGTSWNIGAGMSGSISLTANTQHHFAIVYNGTTYKAYLDGALDWSLTAAAVVTRNEALWIGMSPDNSNYSFSGKIYSARFVNGTAVYTTTFTPPTIPLTAIANTQLLCCQGTNPYIDQTGLCSAATGTGTTVPAPVAAPANNSLTFAWLGGSSFNSLAVQYYGNWYTFGTTPTDGLAHRVVLVGNGTSLSCFVDNVQLGSTVTLPVAFDMSNTNGTSMLTFGGSQRSYLSGVQNYFNGLLSNLQLWNAPWTTTDVGYDYAHQSSVVSANTGNTSMTLPMLRGKFLHNETLTESKTTNSNSNTYDTLVNGLTISLPAGTTGTSYVQTDYYTFGVCNGILKDNATTLYTAYNFYFGPVVQGCTDLGNNGVIGVIQPAISSATVSQWNSTTSTATINSTTNQATNASTSTITYAIGSLNLVGDFDVSITNVGGSGNANDVQVGIGTIQAGLIFGVNLINTSSQIGLFPVDNGVIQAGTVQSTSVSDIHRFTRTAGVCRYYYNGTLKYTSTNTLLQVMNLYGGAYTGAGYPALGVSFGIGTINSSGATYGALLGSSTNQTGIYDPLYFSIDLDSPLSNFYNVAIGGTPVANLYGNGTSPAVGEASIVAGAIICNATNAGQTLTATYNYLQKPT